jgi:ribosome-binding factor A
MSSDKHVNRVQRVEKEVKQCLASLLINQIQRDWSGILTISKVKMPADLRSVKVFVTYLGDESEKKKVLHTLNSEVKFLQSEISHTLKLRYCPRITFEWDLGYESSLNIDKILHNLASSTRLEKLDKSDKDEA